jgi:hypothetical protein
MPKSNKSSKSEKGCVGFVSGGVLKQGHIRLISSDSCDPEEVIQEYVKYYGDSVKLKYVPVENASDYLEKFAEKLEESDDKSRLDENFFHFGSVDAATILREVTDAKSAKKYSVKKKGDDDEDDKSGDEDDKKPAKKPAKKSSKKKEESEDEKDEDKSDGEKSDDEDKKSKKKDAKKPAKKSSKKKEESEDEDEKDDSDDEGEKLKKTTKGGK